MAQIIDIMNEYPNVYTDFSFFCEDDFKPGFLQEFYNKVYCRIPKTVQDRMMYGSDYMMISLFKVNLKNYIDLFREVFGMDFAKISEENPKRFLGL
jgi:predicted TIM-barrel fold metal-dependent hydrolase